MDLHDHRNDTVFLLLDYTLDDLWEILERNNFHLCLKTSHWLTKQQMIRFYKVENWCPRKTQVRLRSCPRPPRKDQVIRFLNDAIAREVGEDKQLQYKPTSMPDLGWMLAALGTLEPKHPIFMRDYFPGECKDPHITLKMEHLKFNGMMRDPIFRGLPD